MKLTTSFFILLVPCFIGCGDSENNNQEPEPDRTFGQLCPDESSGTFDISECDPVSVVTGTYEQTGCGEEERCTLARDGYDGTATAICEPRATAINGPGSSCSESSCVPGQFCLIEENGTTNCRAICNREDGAGCAETEFCSPLGTSGAGVCLTACGTPT